MTDGDGFPYFIDAVSQRSGLPAEEAALLARAVLQTLAERVTGDAPGDLVGHLPNEVDGYLSGPAPGAAGASAPAPDAAATALPAPDPAGALGPDAGADGLTSGVGLEVGGAGATPMEAGPTEFLRRVEQRAGVDPATARAGTGAVFATLRTAMTVREFQEMVARLPRDGGGGAAPTPPADRAG
ncbi:hypothetical protein PSN13_03043 [Micromonospora saelicesensis]|uniref:DUF2267 domain-containing protein n=1 Tax=Micromonospora saelicesensis TaxID=285676 RepID=A0A328NSA1_9ACTN|nr:DUF2267 domain-containing protein [Micromonospora saelicesensis]RAO34176.1 hypothetical protein PSN13_03043 [Micromonospora saelicesensis]